MKDPVIISLLADFILGIHVLWVAFIILLVPLVIIGKGHGWRWIRNPWLRWGHLLMILAVAGESILGIRCPLTVSEDGLRRRLGQSSHEQSFVADALHALLYSRLPEWMFTAAYLLMALLIAYIFLKVPPTRRRP